MYVVATAGHVDHGKSTLVRALTGIEPDRWEDERRRGLTIDLGYAWMDLPDGRTLAFVDVPGHRRFIGNMLAGLGPVPAVLLVVAADAGWCAQSAEHLRAIEALGIEHGLLVLTRADLTDAAGAQATLARARAELAGGPLDGCEAVVVSAVTGSGMAELTAALGRLVSAMPAPPTTPRVRLWIDRAFTIGGAGTVVTGTLAAGQLALGDELELLGARAGSHAGTGSRGGPRVRIRGLQSLGRPREAVAAPARVAVNLRGVSVQAVHRGQVLVTPGAWRPTKVVDARIVGRPTRATPLGSATSAETGPRLPSRLTLHIGTAARLVHLRPLPSRTSPNPGATAEPGGTGREAAPAPQPTAGLGESVRVLLPEALPLTAGDRAILRDPGDASGEALVGIVVVDADPPDLTRRGDAARRGAELAARATPGQLDVAAEVAARGAMKLGHARDLGLDPTVPARGVRRQDDWLIAEATWQTWAEALQRAVAEQARTDRLDPYLPLEAARAACRIPDRRLLPALAEDAGLEVTDGRVHAAGARPDLGPAEAGLRHWEDKLEASPFAAPEVRDLKEARLGARELAAAVATGRLLRLAEGVYLQPIAPAKAMRVLAGLPQPFTTSQARQALDTTRRVAIPLLEHLDARGWTTRLDAGHRIVAR